MQNDDRQLSNEDIESENKIEEEKEQDGHWVVRSFKFIDNVSNCSFTIMWSNPTPEFNKWISDMDVKEILIMINEIRQKSILIISSNNSRHTKRGHVEYESKQIQDYAKSCIEDMIEKLEQQNMMSVFDDKLDLQSEEDSSNLVIGIQSSQVVCQADLMSLKFFPHKRRSQYNFD